MLAAAKEEMLLSPLPDPCVFFPLAADPAELGARFGTTPQLSENSRQGFARKNLALHPGTTWSNSGTALGIEPVWLVNSVRSRCTGKERDPESGCDYFGARYYCSIAGRFAAPDPLMASAHVKQPQSWNRYAYTLNNPLRFLDPDGMDVPDDCAKDPECKIVVKVNVIYDKNANDGKGLTDEQKKAFEQQQLESAKEKYGAANIEIQATYTEGTWTVDANGQVRLEGTRSDSLNVVVSDSAPSAAAGVAGERGHHHRH